MLDIAQRYSFISKSSGKYSKYLAKSDLLHNQPVHVEAVQSS